ncbi:MAG: hypothetical protein GVY10_10700 [Verrucomicrobia bacterium]|jgi:hypothetical protein|nr:hypothetical protein [Verrucomicrobiota bacterium]
MVHDRRLPFASWQTGDTRMGSWIYHYAYLPAHTVSAAFARFLIEYRD